MRKQTLFITLGIIFFIVAPVVAFSIYASQSLLFTPHGYISLAAVPSPIHVITEGRATDLKANQKYPVEVGLNSIIFSASGFESKTIHITIKKDKTITIPVQLTPITNTAKNEASNPKYQEILQQITAINKAKQIETLDNDNPILNQLPISTYDYTISPCNQGSTTISICIDSFVPGTAYMQQEGIDKLKSLGYNLSRYKIYIDGNLRSI